jgi:hypothetical protein
MPESTYSWRPSPPLAMAVRRALQTLQRHWPRAMALATDSSEAGEEYVNDYARAMQGADLAAIPLAAQQWLADHEVPPKPSELGRVAREVSKRFRANEPSMGPGPAAHVPPPISTGMDTRLADTLSRRARQQLGTADWSLVGAVWALLLQTAPTAAAQEQVRLGRVPLEVFDEAVAQVRRGVRPRDGGPLQPLDSVRRAGGGR